MVPMLLRRLVVDCLEEKILGLPILGPEPKIWQQITLRTPK
jgi:hypothetical protein